MTSPSNSAVQNLLPVQAYFNLDGSFNTFIGQGLPFYATANPSQSGLSITNSTINSTTIGATTPSTGVFTDIETTTGRVLTQPVGATDMVNLLALQSYAAGISWKQPCAVATLTNITLSGLQTIDGYTTLDGDRVLVKNQSSAANNGIYLASATAWTRSLDANEWQEFVSAITFIEYGTQAGGAWFCTATPGGTLGVTALNWSQFTTSATYSAGTGLTLTGSVFSITPVGTASTYGSATQTPVFTTNASGQVTAVTNTTITPAVGSITGLGTNVATALAVNVGSTGAFVVNGGALGTPSSGIVTNLTGTASISINGSVGGTTPNPGAFTYLSTSSVTSTTPTLGFNASNCNIASGATISGSYLQAVMQNKSGTAGASTNWAVSNDLGTDSTYYGEFGMNSSVFSTSTPADFFSINNGVYFSSHDGDVTVGSGNGYKTYLAWGAAGASAHVINATGAIGLNTNLGTTPATSGTTNFGTAGQVMTSQGSASTPIWTTPTTGTVTSVTGTSPVVSSGGNTPAISMPAATGSVNGYLTSTDWTTFNGKANAFTYTSNYIPYGQGTTTPAQSSALQFNGTTLTTTNDASISGLTVGKGGGSVSTNTAVGASALAGANTGGLSVGVGFNAGNANTSGRITAIGYSALSLSTTGVNTSVGYSSLSSNTTGTQNNAFGDQTLSANTTGGSNVAIGDFALRFNTTASNNTAVGYQAGYSQTTGGLITAVGYRAGYSNTGGPIDAFGISALFSNTSGANNVAMGYQALYSTTTSNNNTAVGYQAGYTNTTGTGLTLLGYGAGYTMTGNYNVAVGVNASRSVTSGTYNTTIGTGSGTSITTGSKNSILGCYDGNQGSLDIRTASNYIVLSDGDGNPRGFFDNNGTYAVGTSSTSNVTNGGFLLLPVAGYGGGNFIVGHSSGTSSGTNFSEFRYANSTIGSISQNGTTGVLYNLTSDYRLKNNPQILTGASEFIMALQPKSWDWWDGSGKGVGFIAHEFMEVAKYSGNGVKDEIDAEGNPKYQSIQPSSSEVMANLVALVQEQQALIESLTTRLTALETK